MGVIGIVRFAAACTLRALESGCTRRDGPDENSPRGVKASTFALSMEFLTSAIEFFVSTAASAGMLLPSSFTSRNSIELSTQFHSFITHQHVHSRSELHYRHMQAES